MTTSASIGSGERAVYVPITPCRVMDTRSGADNVGPRSTPIGINETHVIPVRGVNGKCTIPGDAVGLVMNVAVINPTAASFLTVYPADVTRPLAANANWVANQPPLSNAVTADISADGRVAFYNLAGTVDVAADIVGYFADHIHDDTYYTKPQVDAAVAAVDLKATNAATAAADAAAAAAGRRTDVQIAMGNWRDDTARPAVIDVGDQPQGIGYDGRHIWVANGNAGTVSKIDPITNTVVATVTVQAGPRNFVFDGTSLWVTNFIADSVSKINPITNAVTNIGVGDGPLGIAFDGTRVWIANFNADTVSRIDVATNVAAGAVSVGQDPIGVAFDGTFVWVANSTDNDLSRIDAATGVKVALDVALAAASTPSRLLFDGTYMWVGHTTANTVVRINTTRFPLTPDTGIGLAGNSHGAIAYDGQRVFVTATGANRVTSVPTWATVAANDRIDVEISSPIGVFHDGTNLWVTSFNSDTVTKIIT